MLADVAPYVPVILLTLFVNTADIYFLQGDRKPSLQRSPSFWLYLVGQLLIALFAAWLLYAKASMPYSDWPIVAAISTFTGFSVVQSFTLKLGGRGVDARELFDEWKRRVLEDVSKANASEKLVRQSRLADQLAKALTAGALRDAVRFLANSVQTDPVAVLDQIEAAGGNSSLRMAQWIASADIVYAESLLIHASEQA